MPLAQPLTDKQRDERIAFLAHSQEVMHERVALVEQQIAQIVLEREAMNTQLRHQGDTIDLVLKELRANTAATTETKDMLEAWNAVQGTRKVAVALGKLALWLAGVFGAGVALWSLVAGQTPGR